MKLIAHRGNISGPRPDKENNPEYLLRAVDNGYDCEVDVWVLDGDIWLGHDGPDYLVSKEFLQNSAFWNHAKNIQALDFMLQNDIHCFWHEHDERTLTSKNFVWTYPNKELLPNSILCLTSLNDPLPENCYGVCSDWVSEYNIKRIGT